MKTILLLLGIAALLWSLLREATPDPAATPEHPYEPNDADDATSVPEAIPASVVDACRTMDPVTLAASSRVVFLLKDGRTCTLHIPGEGGLHLFPGDEGMLTAQNDTFISFEKPTGETVGAMYYIPAPTAEEEPHE